MALHGMAHSGLAFSFGAKGTVPPNNKQGSRNALWELFRGLGEALDLKFSFLFFAV